MVCFEDAPKGMVFLLLMLNRVTSVARCCHGCANIVPQPCSDIRTVVTRCRSLRYSFRYLGQFCRWFAAPKRIPWHGVTCSVSVRKGVPRGEVFCNFFSDGLKYGTTNRMTDLLQLFPSVQSLEPPEMHRKADFVRKNLRKSFFIRNFARKIS